MEHCFRSLESKCLDRMIFFGQRSLDRNISEYLTHYHAERNHQSLSILLIEHGESVGSSLATLSAVNVSVVC